MNQINPFAGPIAQGTQVQHQQAADKSRQIRRLQNLRKNITAATDESEHAVESSSEVAPIHEDGSKDHPRQRRTKATGNLHDTKGDDSNDSHLDLRA